MNTYIALFRGINVGGNNILPMKELVKMLEDIGCAKVKTYIQSGNVVFQSPEIDHKPLAEKISKNISQHFGFKPKVLLINTADFETAVRNNPYPTENGKNLHFFFMESVPASPDLAALSALKSGREQFSLLENVFYLYAPEGIGRSKLAAKVEQKLGVPVTARNWNTVQKLLEMLKQI